MKTPKYKLSTKYHVQACLEQAQAGNLRGLRSDLRYALYDLGIE